jgi:Ca-activated chloride channel family protein
MKTHEMNEDLLTRYVLGELTEDETRDVKEALMANPEARKTVAELEHTVGLLKEALGGEAVAGLGEEAKERITTEAQIARKVGERKLSVRRLFVNVAVAAAVVAVMFALAVPNIANYLGSGGTLAPFEMAGLPDPATSSTEILQPPSPPAEPLRYSQAETAVGEGIPSTPRSEADAADENEKLDAGGGTSPAPAAPGEAELVAAAAPAAERVGTPKGAAAPAGLKLQSSAPLGDLQSGEGLGQETLPQQGETSTQLPPPQTAALGRSNNLRNVEVGGSIRRRDNAAAPPRPTVVTEAPMPSPQPSKAETPKPEAIARSIESTQSMPSMEETRQLEALGYIDSMDGMDFEIRRRARTSGEQYNPIVENPFKPVANEPLSTFSIDVDTGAYSNVRRYIENGSLPPADAVRIEEMINYFEYGYPKRTYEPGADPFSAAVSVAACPWTPGHKLVRVGIQGASMPEGQRPLSNLVFLLDVSGSMDSPDKLPLVKQGIQMLVNQLGENDKVSIVVYAGSAGVVLPPTNGSNRAAILSAIENLRAGGSTAGGEGILLAYRLARENFIEGGVNRVILATDGDFNVGVSDEAGLIRLIEEQAKSKVFLTVLGFGTGNLQDGKMEQLSNKGNGMYAYIDSLREAKKVFVEQAEGSLITIAKDVKIQIEFNPARVQSYRLIGYENRALAAQDFNDDTKDAGEIGAGHQVTALYEIVPVGALPQEGVDPLKYQKPEAGASEAGALPSGSLATSEYGNELMTLKLRYKQPEGDVSKLLEFPIEDSTLDFARADDDFRFASSVAAFGMLLRGSQHSGSAAPKDVMNWAAAALGDDPHGYRAEFLDLVRKSAGMR